MLNGFIPIFRLVVAYSCMDLQKWVNNNATDLFISLFNINLIMLNNMQKQITLIFLIEAHGLI